MISYYVIMSCMIVAMMMQLIMALHMHGVWSGIYHMHADNKSFM